jgi:hypothetical protein
MVVEVDVIIIRAFPSLYHFHLVTPAARKWVKKNVKGQAAAIVREIAANVHDEKLRATFLNSVAVREVLDESSEGGRSEVSR